VIRAIAEASVRLGLTATVGICAGASLGVSQADAAGQAWRTYLAPVTACAHADDPSTSAAVQQRAIVCLINWARRRDGETVLATPHLLQRAAAVKGRRVASCGEATHAPCGSEPVAALRGTGYRYASFGENLWVGPWGFTARQIVAAWLESPPHRANVLHRGFRHFGVALVHAPGVLGNEAGAVWVVTFASPL
jgi:uncharacterized protein YkwD